MPLTSTQLADIAKIYDIAQSVSSTKDLYSRVTWEKNPEDHWVIKQRIALTKEEVLESSQKNVLPPVYHAVLLGLTKARADMIKRGESDKDIEAHLTKVLNMEVVKFKNTFLVSDAALLGAAHYITEDMRGHKVAEHIANIGCNIMLWTQDPKSKQKAFSSVSEYLDNISVFQQERADRGRGLFGGLGDDRNAYVNTTNSTLISLDPNTLAIKSSGAISKTIAREFKEEMQDAGAKSNAKDAPKKRSIWTILLAPFKAVYNAIAYVVNAIFGASSDKKAERAIKQPRALKASVDEFIQEVSQGIHKKKDTSNVIAYPDYSFIPRDWGSKQSGGYFYLDNFHANPFASYAYCNAMECNPGTLKNVEAALASSKKGGEIKAVFVTPLTEVIDNCYKAKQSGRDGFNYIHEGVGAWDLAYQRIEEGIAAGHIKGYQNTDEAMIALTIERAEKQMAQHQKVLINFDGFTELSAAHMPSHTFRLMKESIEAVKDGSISKQREKLLMQAREGEQAFVPEQVEVDSQSQAMVQNQGALGAVLNELLAGKFRN